MTALELARWQFGITTLYHFIFVPVTIGLTICVAYFQTRWYRSGEEKWLRSTRFWGKLMLISFALGVATGIVQEFQFGMAWSNYSRFVGDIFGAPLAMEGLAAFFVESTFLGLWIFGWGRLSKKVHLACAWLVAWSTALSAYFILAANSWMQHPVGYRLAHGKAELTNIASVLFNSTALYAFAHTILAALLTAGMILIAVSAWHLRRGREVEVFGSAISFALPLVTLAAIATVFETKKGAGLSLFATGDFKSNPEGLNRNVEIPQLLSWISTGYPNGEIKGINNLNREYQRKYGPGNYTPIVGITYWTWRAMLGCAFAMMVFAAVGWWLLDKGKLRDSKRYLTLAVPAVALPFIASATGWLFTEMGRQPWAVFGLLKTNAANSPAVSPAEIWITLVGFTLLYGVLAAIAGRVFVKAVEKGPVEAGKAEEPAQELALAY
ncbi:MAG TPA: cytochrome ubiquinol oxidase subunit I [Solirubrobacterales bacterium]|nr:cytochrome ubiquinol oxidase subunit I [Solirubrobacterales bacterium]